MYKGLSVPFNDVELLNRFLTVSDAAIVIDSVHFKSVSAIWIRDIKKRARWLLESWTSSSRGNTIIADPASHMTKAVTHRNPTWRGIMATVTCVSITKHTTRSPWQDRQEAQDI